MAQADKNEAIAELESGIRAIDRILVILDDMKVGASFADRKRLLKIMANLSERRQNAAALVAHMRAAEVEVAPAAEGSYEALDAALKELQEFQQATGTVKKAIQVAGAIASAVMSTREGVSQRAV